MVLQCMPENGPIFKSLKEISRILGFKDVRTVRKWCIKNEVQILNDPGNRGKYVITAEFEAARYRQMIHYLKGKHGKKWRDALTAYLQVDSLFRVAQSKTNIANSQLTEQMGQHERKFLSSLTANSSEL